MSLSVCSIASGSRGNCTAVKGDDTLLLIDVGVPLDYLIKSMEGLGLKPEDVDGVLVTHEHGDHTAGLAAFLRRYNAPLYIHESAAAGVKKRLRGEAANFTAFKFGYGDFFIKTLGVSPIELPHDVPCTGFTVWDREERVSVITDLGVLTPRILQAVADSGVVMIESNHDVDLLKASPKYPPVLKRRILSAHGHLSNAECAQGIVRLYGAGALKAVILAHLSMENNYPDLALSALRAAFIAAGADPGGLEIRIAGQYAPTGFLSVTHEAKVAL